MFRLRLIVIATTMALAACSQQPNGAASSPATTASTAAASSAAPAATAMTSNPFFSASTLPFQAPPFDKIKDADYQPAIDEGMKQQLAEIEKIANNPDAPTFENTYVAMEKSGVMLKRVLAVFSAVTGANTDDALQKVQEDEAPKLAAEARAQSDLYDALNVHDDQFDASDAAISTAISIAAVAALAEAGLLLGVAWAFGAFGVFMGLCGFFGWGFHPAALSGLLG